MSGHQVDGTVRPGVAGRSWSRPSATSRWRRWCWRARSAPGGSSASGSRSSSGASSRCSRCCDARAGSPTGSPSPSTTCRPAWPRSGALDARRRRRGRLRPDERSRRPRVRPLRACAGRESAAPGRCCRIVRVDWSDRLVRADQPRRRGTEPLRDASSAWPTISSVHGKHLLGVERGPGQPRRRSGRPPAASPRRSRRPGRCSRRPTVARRTGRCACTRRDRHSPRLVDELIDDGVLERRGARRHRDQPCGRSSSCTGAGWRSTCSRSPTPPASSTIAPPACASAGRSTATRDGPGPTRWRTRSTSPGPPSGRATIASCKTGGHDVNGPLYELLTLAERAAGRSVVTGLRHDRYAGPRRPASGPRRWACASWTPRGWPIRPSCCSTVERHASPARTVPDGSPPAPAIAVRRQHPRRRSRSDDGLLERPIVPARAPEAAVHSPFEPTSSVRRRSPPSSRTRRSTARRAPAGRPRTSSSSTARPSAPRRSRSDFTHTDPWRVLRIQGEFVAGFDALADVGPAVTIFGSARTPRTDPMYGVARGDGAAAGRGRLRDHHRRRAGHHGGGEPRRPRGQGALDRLRHRAAARAGAERVRGRGGQLPLLLRPQDDVREVRRGVRDLPGRLRHAGRAVRGADADPDGEGPQLPGRARRPAYWAGCWTGSRTTLLAEGKIRRDDLDLLPVHRRPGRGRADHRGVPPRSDCMDTPPQPKPPS